MFTAGCFIPPHPTPLPVGIVVALKMLKNCNTLRGAK